MQSMQIQASISPSSYRSPIQQFVLQHHAAASLHLNLGIQAFQDCRQSPYRISPEPHLASRGICFCHLAYAQLLSSFPIVNATLMKYELLLGQYLKTAAKNLDQTKLLQLLPLPRWQHCKKPTIPDQSADRSFPAAHCNSELTHSAITQPD